MRDLGDDNNNDEKSSLDTGVIKRVPNWLTGLRLVLIPIFVMLLWNSPSKGQVKVAAVIFILAALTDLIDGIIARRYRAETDLGKLLDPLADKILVMAALVMLTSLRSNGYDEPWVSPVLVVIILAREIWVTGLRGIAASHGVVIAAKDSGKWKSVFQMVAIVFLLLRDYGIPVLGWMVPTQFVGLNLLLVSVFFSLWSAMEYTLMVMGNRAIGNVIGTTNRS